MKLLLFLGEISKLMTLMLRSGPHHIGSVGAGRDLVGVEAERVESKDKTVVHHAVIDTLDPRGGDHHFHDLSAERSDIENARQTTTGKTGKQIAGAVT